MSRSRQLAAIMFTDIQGYTALMQQDEQKAILVRDKHRRIFNTCTEKYKGKVLQYFGDGTLSIFGSAVDAVACGIDMQLGFRKEPAIPVRIGIHTGDIFFSDEEIIGDSVNVASRIESLAVPGSILISGKVYDEIKNQGTIRTSHLVTCKFKNVERPIEVYAISNEGLVVPGPEELSGKMEAILPPVAEKAKDPETLSAATPFLATKFFIPPLREKLVHRPRLVDRINSGLSGNLTLISAPAGFGKTTLVSEWIAGTEMAVAWLSLQESDSDPKRFLMYVVAAIRTIKAGFGENLLAVLQSPQSPPVESVLTLLLNEITAIPDRFALVLDDYHHLDSRSVDEALGFLLDHLPPQMHLVITTREDPSLPLPRLRVRGKLTELRERDLKFTSSEAASFLNEVMALKLSEEAVSALETRTEGWIAGLQMAALSMEGREDAAGFVQAFTGSHRFILDYLMEEVLQQQPAAVRDFLLQTSILDRLCGSLCDAVTGREDSHTLLEQLERSNLFVVPLDDQRRWYRYHHLFAEVLRARSAEEWSEQLSALHRRAGKWYEEYGATADAVYHAIAGKDPEQAARLIELAWPEMDVKFQTSTWLGWAQTLPEEVIRTRPVLVTGCAWALLSEGELEAGQARLQQAERMLGIADGNFKDRQKPADEVIVIDKEQFRFLPASIATARAYFSQASGDIPASVAFAQQALDLLPAGDHLRRGPAAALLGLALWANGKLEEAHRALAEAMDNFRMAGHLGFALSGTYGLADIRIAQGHLHDAIATYERALQLVPDPPPPGLRGIADLYLGLGDLYREQGDLEAAARQLQKSEELGEHAALQDWPSRFRVAGARLKQAQGDPDGALELLDQAERLYYRTPVPEVLPIAAQKAQLWARQGRVEKALAWARDRGLTVKDELTYLRDFEHITLARILIAQYKKERKEQLLDKALTFLERLLQTAQTNGWMESGIRIRILQALAQEAAGNLIEALAVIEPALVLAVPESYIRIFADEGEPMARILAEAAGRGIPPDYLSNLLAHCRPQEQKPEERPTDILHQTSRQLIEPLSERELEVLRLIAQGFSNQEISRKLFLALSTVKGHNRKIFDKLDVRRRTEAVARARELGLL